MTSNRGAALRPVAALSRSATLDTPAQTWPGGAECLIAEVGAGSEPAFEELHTQLRTRVFGFVLSIVRDRHLAEEVTQEVFVQIWRQALRFDPARGAAVAWMLQLAHARAVDRVRQQQASRLRDHSYATARAVAEIDTVIEDVLRREQRTCVRVALANLTAIQRESITLVYYHGMTTGQISAHLGVAQPTIKTRIRDGLKKMAIQLAASPTGNIHPPGETPAAHPSSIMITT